MMKMFGTGTQAVWKFQIKAKKGLLIFVQLQGKAHCLCTVLCVIQKQKHSI